MKFRPLVTSLVISLASAALVSAGLSLAAPAASAATTAEEPLGTRSLAAVLTSDGNRFDHNRHDYDLTTEAVLAVLEAKPRSGLGVLTRGGVRLTAFIPNDLSFRVLAYDLTGRWIRSEARILSTLVDAVGVDAIESVLLYHVVPGGPLGSGDVLAANNAVLETALEGATWRVRAPYAPFPYVRLIDADRNDADPFANPEALDINRGNRQIAHGIYFVLRPLDL